MDLQVLIDTILNNDILLYVGMIIEGIVSIFLWKKGSKKNFSIVDSDITSLIEYHEKVAKELKKKVNKE